jgi:hypothetical protein
MVWRPHRGTPDDPGRTDWTCKLHRRLAEALGDDESIVSFNYDTAFDLAALEVWYGQEWSREWQRIQPGFYGWLGGPYVGHVVPSTRPGRLLKPNGSISLAGMTHLESTGQRYINSLCSMPSVFQDVVNEPQEISAAIWEPLIGLPDEEYCGNQPPPSREAARNPIPLVRGQVFETIQDLARCRGMAIAIGFSFAGKDGFTTRFRRTLSESGVEVGLVNPDAENLARRLQGQGLRAIPLAPSLAEFLVSFRSLCREAGP